jgi:hypothetical protein
MLFFNSPLIGGLISGIATLVTGLIAIYVFKLQKKNQEINAATTILLEIRNAENKINEIIERLDKQSHTDLPSVLPTNSWRRNSHLFVKHLDLDNIELLNTFYTSCEIIEDLVNRQNNYFWITTEERAKTVQHLLATIHDDYQKDRLENDVNAQAKFDARKSALDQFYGNDSLSYAPNKTVNGLKYHSQKLQRIIATPCGEQLKKIAKLSK